MSEENEKLKAVLGNLSKDTLKRIGMADATEINRLETPSVGLTRALSGGWALGRQNLIWGAKSAGKSTFVLQQIAIAQEKGMVCALLDVEATLDKTWAARQGVNNSELLHSAEGSIVGVVNAMADLMKAGVDFIAVDSISTLLPITFMDKDGSLKAFENTGAIGGMSRSIGPALSQMNYVMQQVDHEPMVLYVSQIRNAPKGQHWGVSPMGGTAMEHAASQSVRLNSSPSNTVTGEARVGDRLISKSIGRKVDWVISKDKVGPGDGLTGEYTLYFDGDHVGIDGYAELVSLASEVGVIRKAGAWYSYDGEQLGQGEAKAAQTLREQPDTYRKVVDEFYGR